MARPFLFGGSTGSNPASKYLVEFKAGKMVMRGTTVTPINRKGSVFLNQTDDGLMHFCWKDRTTGETEDDLIIFPDDAEFKRITACKTGRVYMLKFKSSNKKNFYWMQESKEDSDDELCKKVNEYLNNPPAPGSRTGHGSGSSGTASLNDLGGLNDADLQNLLNNMSPQQLMQMLGGVTGLPNAGSLSGLLGSGSTERQSRRERSSGATTAPATTSTTNSTSGPKSSSGVTNAAGNAAPIQLADFANILSGLTVPASNGSDNEVNIDLSASINYESLKPLLDNEDFMARVRESLPPSVDGSGNTVPISQTQVPEQLASTVQSPQFQAALSIFSSALQSGQLGPLVQQFNLGQECVDAATRGDLEAFVKGLDKTSSSKGEDDKKDDEMALD